MLDELLLNFKNRNTILKLDPHFSPDQSLTGTIHYPAKSPSSKLVVIFPYWRSSDSKVLNVLISRLNKRNVSALLLDFHPDHMMPDVETVLASHDVLRAGITSVIKHTTKQYGYKEVHLVGFSMGNVVLSLVAKDFKNFLSATQVLGASEIVGPLLEGSRTKALRISFNNQGIIRKQLEKSWTPLNPETHPQAFKNKTVTLISSKHDMVIPTKYQERYAHILRENGAHLIHKAWQTNHTITILRFCFLSKLDQF